MKGFYKLSSFQFWSIGVKTFFICIALLVFQIVSFSNQLFGSGIRLEQFMQRSGFDMMFMIAYVLILAVIVISVYQKYFGSKSIYTIMSLPVSRASIYLSFIIPGVIAVLMLCLTQIANVFICHQITLDKLAYHSGMLSSTITTQPVKVDYMNNDIFLAFVRYDYLRLLLPLSLFDLARSLCLLIAPVVTLVFTALCERSKKYGLMALVLLQAILLWQIAGNINNTSTTTAYGTSIVCICICSAVTLLCEFLSYRLIKSKAIV